MIIFQDEWSLGLLCDENSTEIPDSPRRNDRFQLCTALSEECNELKHSVGAFKFLLILKIQANSVPVFSYLGLIQDG